MYKALPFFVFGLMACVLAKAQAPTFDVQHYRFAVQINDDNDTLKGQAKIRMKFLKYVADFQLDLVKTKGMGDTASNFVTNHVRDSKTKISAGKGMLVSQVTEDKQPMAFIQEDG